MPKLSDLTIAILTEEGFEQVELTSPRETLEKSGVTVHIISPKGK
jgi:protease I